VSVVSSSPLATHTSVRKRKERRMNAEIFE
jgi:hypothetical protein